MKELPITDQQAQGIRDLSAGVERAQERLTTYLSAILAQHTVVGNARIGEIAGAPGRYVLQITTEEHDG